MVRILSKRLPLNNEGLGKNRNVGTKREETSVAPHLGKIIIIIRYKKQPDVDEIRVQFPSLRNGREMMFLVKTGKQKRKEP